MRVAVGWPPAAQLMATPMSDTPISVMTVPVTSGGNTPSTRPMSGATSMPNTPATMVAP
ncbi:hypothetical protein D3C72_1075900 [compost metagenome]